MELALHPSTLSLAGSSQDGQGERMAQVWVRPGGSPLSQSMEPKDQGAFPACLLPRTYPPPRVDRAFPCVQLIAFGQCDGLPQAQPGTSLIL